MKEEKYQLILKKYKKVIRKYYEQLFANRLDNLEEMNKFLETHSLPKVKQEDMVNWNRAITILQKQNVTCNKQTNKQNLSANRSSGPDGFTGEFYQTCKELILILLQTLPRD